MYACVCIYMCAYVCVILIFRLCINLLICPTYEQTCTSILSNRHAGTKMHTLILHYFYEVSLSLSLSIYIYIYIYIYISSIQSVSKDRGCGLFVYFFFLTHMNCNPYLLIFNLKLNMYGHLMRQRV